MYISGIMCCGAALGTHQPYGPYHLQTTMSLCCPPRPLHAAAIAEPLLLQFKRAPASSTMHCDRTRAAVPPHAPAVPVRFLDIRDGGAGETVFSYADTRERWAQITHSAELGGDVLDAPSLGLLQIPLSTYLDDMTALFPRRCVRPSARVVQLRSSAL